MSIVFVVPVLFRSFLTGQILSPSIMEQRVNNGTTNGKALYCNVESIPGPERLGGDLSTSGTNRPEYQQAGAASADGAGNGG